jgi:hypothetical protein
MAARRALGIPVNQAPAPAPAAKNVAAPAQSGNAKQGAQTLTKQKSMEADSFQNVGAVSMESSNQDFVSELIAIAKEENRDSRVEPVRIDPTAAAHVKLRLVRQGFSDEQVQVAMQRSGETSYESLLDDLILNTPDAQLPPKFRHALSASQKKALPTPTIMRPGDPRTQIPENGFAPASAPAAPAARAAGPSAGSGPVRPTSTPLSSRDENSIAELCALGFPRADCLAALTYACGDTDFALRRLCAGLYPPTRVGPAAPIGRPDDCTEESLEEARFDERTALEHIYGEGLVREIWFQMGTIVGVEVSLEEVDASLTVRYDLPNLYPWQAPYLLLARKPSQARAKGGLSAADCALLTRRLAGEACGMVTGSGMPIAFDLCNRAIELVQQLRAERAPPPSADPPGERGGGKGRKERGGREAAGPVLLVPKEDDGLVAGKKISTTQKEMYTVAAERTKQRLSAQEAADARQAAELQARADLARKLCAEAQARASPEPLPLSCPVPSRPHPHPLRRPRLGPRLEGAA